jgi:WD40 repeat protein
MSESIACFTGFYEIKVFPLLHLDRIKVKVEGSRDNDSHILATKYIPKSTLLTVHNDNTVRKWNLKTGKFTYIERKFTEAEDDLSEYVFH